MDALVGLRCSEWYTSVPIRPALGLQMWAGTVALTSFLCLAMLFYKRGAAKFVGFWSAEQSEHARLSPTHGCDSSPVNQTTKLNRSSRAKTYVALLPPPRRLCFRVCLFVCLLALCAKKLPNGFACNFQGRLATGQ